MHLYVHYAIFPLAQQDRKVWTLKGTSNLKLDLGLPLPIDPTRITSKDRKYPSILFLYKLALDCNLTWWQVLMQSKMVAGLPVKEYGSHTPNRFLHDIAPEH
ncbi:jg19919 [Pararge aegeria aegeria]|uniref:Jg19919 protein n=1 Tax=Pararge aegeria aegeria TaxID=348720 RepID=A0A8S4S819_9NEOP|nr:jg19919 [Pararge aegeria aegeria]